MGKISRAFASIALIALSAEAFAQDAPSNIHAAAPTPTPAVDKSTAAIPEKNVPAIVKDTNLAQYLFLSLAMSPSYLIISLANKTNNIELGQSNNPRGNNPRVVPVTTPVSIYFDRAANRLVIFDCRQLLTLKNMSLKLIASSKVDLEHEVHNDQGNEFDKGIAQLACPVPKAI